MPDPGLIYISTQEFGQGYDLFIVCEDSYLVFGHGLLPNPVRNEFQEAWNMREDVIDGMRLAVDDRTPDALG